MIINGDCLEEMKKFPDNHFNCVLTDPPYGLHFMGKKWDKFNRSNFDENGKHKHLENASVDRRSRDVRKIMTGNSLAGSYDPKRDDEFQEFIFKIGKELLRICKPGTPLLMFGSPRRHHRQMLGLEGAGWEIRDCLQWIFGKGLPKSHNHFGLEGYGTALKPTYEPIILCMKPLDGTFKQNAEKWGVSGINIESSRVGDRWPANVLFDEEAAEQLDEMTDINASRFFYCAKASSSERNATPENKNSHPTVKPIKLMEYLLKLIAPPKNAFVLDPFLGSGTTLVAAKNLGINAVGIELSEEYCEIAKRRVEHVETNLFNFEIKEQTA